MSAYANALMIHRMQSMYAKGLNLLAKVTLNELLTPQRLNLPLLLEERAVPDLVEALLEGRLKDAECEWPMMDRETAALAMRSRRSLIACNAQRLHYHEVRAKVLHMLIREFCERFTLRDGSIRWNELANHFAPRCSPRRRPAAIRGAVGAALS